MTLTGIDTVLETNVPQQDFEQLSEGLLDGRDFSGRQSIGVREIQEDCYGVVPHIEFAGGPNDILVLVADGMGGHAAGEVASSIVVHSFAETFWESSITSDPGRLWDCLERANRRLATEMQSSGDAVAGMGTTLLAVLLRDKFLRWLSVGDSPLYHMRGDALVCLNIIHSKATDLAQQVQLGLITEEQARKDSSRHELLSALIGDVIHEVDDPPPIELLPGDIIIAATDGIETLTHGEIAAAVSNLLSQNAEAIAEGLLQAIHAKQSPKQDNTTVVVLRIPS